MNSRDEEIELALAELRDEFPTWRIGRDSAGRYWAVQHTAYFGAKTVTELRTKLRQR